MSTLNFRHLAQKTLFVAGANLLLSFKGLLLLPFFIKGFGATGYGLWAQLLALVELLVPLVSLGLTTTLLKQVPIQKNRSAQQILFLRSIALPILIALGIMGILLWSRSYWFPAFFNSQTYDPSDPLLLRISTVFVVLIPVTILFQFGQAFLRAQEKVGSFIIFSFLDVYGFISILILIVLRQGSMYQLALFLLFLRATLVAFQLCFILKGFNTHEKLDQTEYRLKSLLLFSLPLVLGHASYLILLLIDRFFIGYYHNVEEVARYAAIYTISQVIILCYSPIGWFALQQQSKLWKEKDFKGLNRFLYLTLKYPLILAIPFVFATKPILLPLLGFLTGKAIHAPLVVTLLIITSYLIEQQETYAYNLLLLVKKQKLVLYANLVAVFLNLVLNFLWVPEYGIVGAAWATFVAFGFKAMWMMIVANQNYKIPIPYVDIVKIIFASSVALVVASFFSFWMALVAMSLVYLALVLILRIVPREEIKFWKQFVTVRNHKISGS